MSSWPENSDGGTLGDGRPACATDRPRTVDELSQLVAERVGQGHAIYPQGGSTALDYGGIPARPGVAIDLRGLDRVIDYPAADMTITIEGGLTLSKLRATLLEQGQRLCVEAPQPDQATMGGIFATGTSGPRRFGQGRPRDQIIGVQFVDARGDRIKGGGRVVKNVAGYDLPKLLTGSMGTLGILTELTLKVRPLPEASALVWVRFRRLAEIAQAVDRLNTSGTRPVAIEWLNAPAASRVGRLDDLPVEEWVLVLGFEDNSAAVAWQIDRLAIELGRTDLIIRQGDPSATLWASLVESQAAIDGPISFSASIRPSAIPSFLATIEPALWEIQAHAGNGIVRGHSIGHPSLEEIQPEVLRLRAEATRLGGTLVLPRCPTDWKAALSVWGPPGPDSAIARRVKLAFDPSDALNPGRFVEPV